MGDKDLLQKDQHRHGDVPLIAWIVANELKAQLTRHLGSCVTLFQIHGRRRATPTNCGQLVLVVFVLVMSR